MPNTEELAPLSAGQRYALKLFYETPDVKVKFNKAKRAAIDKKFTVDRSIELVKGLENEVPAFYAEIEKAIKIEKNIQSAVFSECVYTQALADKLQLTEFRNHVSREKFQIEHFFPDSTELANFIVRYSFRDKKSGVVLVQAGGKDAVDCALISKDDSQIVKIEFKEPYARASDVNLPKYGEDGKLVTSELFASENPQFTNMLEEHLKLEFNVFEHLGNNIGNFEEENIKSAVLSNYLGDKFADVICTEDKSGYLVMLPANHVSHWAKLEGELRPTGRNSCEVWTPKKLQKTLDELEAKEVGNAIEIDLSKLKATKARGGSKTSRYKLSPLFFLRASEVLIEGNKVKFKKQSVLQNIPSISSKMKFKNLQMSEIQSFYKELL
jgi:hypothetical protein